MAQRRADWARLAGHETAIFGRIPSGRRSLARPLEPVLGAFQNERPIIHSTFD
jgi:hypothetical protein